MISPAQITTVLLLLGGFSPTPEKVISAVPTPVPVRMVLVEGVAASSQAAPVTVLREMGERLLGRSFTVLYGKFVALGKQITPTPLDTRRKKLVSIEKLPTGLFKAVLEVESPRHSGNPEEKLRERTQRGTGELQGAGSPLLARELAREDALEKAILATVAERYPGDSAPSQLAGRVFFLGTLREEMDAGNYIILARIKVWLTEP